MSDKPRYNIGDPVFVAGAHAHTRQNVKCPLCFGNLFITLTLGDGSVEQIECGACGHGYDGPRGYIAEWGPYSYTRSGTITGVSKDHFGGGWRYEVDGHTEDEIFTSAEEAEARRVELFAQAEERARTTNLSIANTKKKGLAWSVRYHRERIRDAERQLKWHKDKLQIDSKKLEKKGTVA